MYKEKLQELFIERFLNDKIDSERFTALIEKSEIISENKAKKLTEDYAPVRKTVMSTVGVATGVSSIRRISMIWDQCVTSCGAMAVNSPRRQLCLHTCKAQVLKKKLELAKSNGKDTSKLKSKLDKIESILNKYKEGAKKHGVNPEVDVKPYGYSPFKIPR